MSTLDEIRTLAARQHSVVGRSQLLRLGMTPAQIQHFVETGALVRRGRSAFVIGGAASTVELEALAAVVDAGPGAALAWPSALAWWTLPGFEVEPVHVLRPHGPGPTAHPNATVHTSRRLPSHHVTVNRGVPVVTPARALFDAAGFLRPGRMERVLEKAWARHLVDGTTLHDMLAELGGRGRPGSAVMRELLSTRPPGYVPCESGLELRFAKLLLDDGQASMDRQVEVGGTFWIGRVDFIDRDARVIVEVQSIEHHGTPSERAADAARIAALVAAGWTVIEATELELWFDPGGLVRRVRHARARRPRAA